MKAGIYKVEYIVKMTKSIEVSDDEIAEHGEDVFAYAIVEDGFEYDEAELVVVFNVGGREE